MREAQAAATRAPAPGPSPRPPAPGAGRAGHRHAGPPRLLQELRPRIPAPALESLATTPPTHTTEDQKLLVLEKAEQCPNSGMPGAVVGSTLRNRELSKSLTLFLYSAPRKPVPSGERLEDCSPRNPNCPRGKKAPKFRGPQYTRCGGSVHRGAVCQSVFNAP